MAKSDGLSVKILSKIRGFYVMIEFVITVLITIVLMYTFRQNTHPIRRTWGKMQTFLMGSASNKLVKQALQQRL